MSPELLDQFVAELVSALAPRVAAELASQMPVPAAAESWRLLNVDEAAAALGRSTRWVRQKAKDGSLPYVRLDGGSLRFEVDDLRAFAMDRRVSAERGETLAGRLRLLGDPARGAGLGAPDRVDNRRATP